MMYSLKECKVGDRVGFEFISEDLYAVFLENGWFNGRERIGKVLKCVDKSWYFFGKNTNIPSPPFSTLEECKEYVKERN